MAIVGSEIDDPSLTKLIEGCGALIVSDRFCFGSTPGREVIELNDEEDVLRQICRHYMETSECARYISDEKVHQRRETADRLAREYKADGIIYEQMKYCDYWGFERALASYIMNTEYGWPVLSIDRVYNNGYSGQLRTRVQAFVESWRSRRSREKGVPSNGQGEISQSEILQSERQNGLGCSGREPETGRRHLLGHVQGDRLEKVR